MNAPIIAILGILALTASLVCGTLEASLAQTVDNQTALRSTESDDSTMDERTAAALDGDTAEEPGIQPPSGPGDAELQGEKPKRNWLPPEETGLGMPQGVTGGGFPDRSTRTGTFGSDTAIPGAGGTRAGR